MRSKLPDARWMAAALFLSASALAQADLQRQYGAHAPGNEMIVVNVLTDHRTDRVRLVPGRDRVVLSASR